MGNRIRKWKVWGMTALAAVILGSSYPEIHTAYAKPKAATIENPGFEKNAKTGVPGWEQWYGSTGFTVTKGVASEGKSSLEIKDEQTDASYWMFSSKLPAKPGDTFEATGKAMVVSGHIQLNVAFFSEAGTMLNYVENDIAGPVGAWSDTKASGIAPEGTAYAAVFLYSGYSSVGHGYVDAVSLAGSTPLVHVGAKTDLGQIVKAPLTVGAEIGATAAGNNEVYVGLNGAVSTFYALDAETGSVKFSQEMPGITHLYGITMGSDGNVYFTGTHDGVLYRYLPSQMRVERLGTNPSDPWVWDLAASSDGKIYGATYGSSKVFEYDIATGSFRDLGPIRPAGSTQQEYARGIGVTDQYLYVAVGIPEALIRIDRQTGVQTEIQLPYSGQTRMAADVWVYNGNLFVRDESSTLFVLDEATLEVKNTIRFKATISPPSPSDPNVIYYKKDSALYTYNMATNKTAMVEGLPTLPMTTPVKFQWITPKSGPKAGVPVLATMLEFTEYMLYDPQDGWFQTIPLQVAPQGIEIQSVEKGPDGKLYVGGYQKAMSIYDPASQTTLHSEAMFPQPEGIGFLNGKAYFGTYGGAVMYRYDPAQPYHYGGTPDDNPGLVYDIQDQQDRPFAITSGDNKLFVGTVAEYGVLGGALTVYDEAAGTWTVHRNVVQNQSVTGLAYRDGKLFGSTSIWGGLGIQPTETEAKIFVWDVASGTKTAEFSLQIPGIDEAPKLIGDLSFGPDGLLWGIAGGTVFALDPDTYRLVKSKMIFPSNYVSNSNWRPYYIRWGSDGLMYTTLGRNLTVIDPSTLEYTVVEPGVSLMTIGDDGNLYYASGSNLMKLEILH